MTYPIKSLKELRGKLKRMELVKNPTPAQIKEIGWLKQCIEKKESEVEK